MSAATSDEAQLDLFWNSVGEFSSMRVEIPARLFLGFRIYVLDLEKLVF